MSWWTGNCQNINMTDGYTRTHKKVWQFIHYSSWTVLKKTDGVGKEQFTTSSERVGGGGGVKRVALWLTSTPALLRHLRRLPNSLTLLLWLHRDLKANGNKTKSSCRYVPTRSYGKRWTQTMTFPVVRNKEKTICYSIDQIANRQLALAVSFPIPLSVSFPISALSHRFAIWTIWCQILNWNMAEIIRTLSLKGGHRFSHCPTHRHLVESEAVSGSGWAARTCGLSGAGADGAMGLVPGDASSEMLGGRAADRVAEAPQPTPLWGPKRRQVN